MLNKDFAYYAHSNDKFLNRKPKDDLALRCIKLKKIAVAEITAKQIFQIAVPIRVRGKIWGVGRIEYSTTRLDKMTLHLYKKFLVFALAFFLIGIVFTFLLMKDIAKNSAECNQREQKLKQSVIERTLTAEKRAQELARSNAELQQFAYVASHDLQEPLRMVTNYMQLLSKHHQQKLDQDAKEFIAYAVDGATRMRALIQDLLAYSQIGGHDDDFTQVDCNLLFKQIILNLQVAIEENKAQVTSDDLPTIKVDQVQIMQLLQNLISNALKFRQETPPVIHVGIQRQKTEWQFCVYDNGIGIESQYSQSIFNMFQRLHHREEYSGTGIGLAICKKIIEKHGGKIWVESKIGVGSKFYFTIPLK